MTSASDRTFDHPEFDPAGQSIMITGGTGSFGRAFVRKLLALPNPPRRVVVFSRDEQKQDTMVRDLRGKYPDDLFSRMRFFVGDVRDQSRLELAMRDIQVVVHAACNNGDKIGRF